MLNKLIAEHIPKGQLKPILASIVADIQQVVSPKQIILFGSLSRDEFRAGSDIDLAVIFRDGEDISAARLAIHKSRKEVRVPVEFLIFSESEFRERKSIGGVCQIIAEDGEVLFDEGREYEC